MSFTALREDTHFPSGKHGSIDVNSWLNKLNIVINQAILIGSVHVCWPSTESLSSNDEGLNEVFYEGSSLVHCEQCGRLTEAYHQRGPRRFCSTSCARRYSVSCSRKMVAFHARTGRGGQHSSANKLASDRKSSHSMPMVSSLCFAKAQNSLTTHLSPFLILRITHTFYFKTLTMHHLLSLSIFTLCPSVKITCYQHPFFKINDMVLPSVNTFHDPPLLCQNLSATSFSESFLPLAAPLSYQVMQHPLFPSDELISKLIHVYLNLKNLITHHAPFSKSLPN